jgi:hypothetical protein
VHVGLADDDRAGLTEPLYHEGVRGCDVAAEGLAAPGGLVPGYVEQFLTRIGMPCNGPIGRAGRARAAPSACSAKSWLVAFVTGCQSWSERRSVGDQFDRADATFPDRAAHVDERDC